MIKFKLWPDGALSLTSRSSIAATTSKVQSLNFKRPLLGFFISKGATQGVTRNALG